LAAYIDNADIDAVIGANTRQALFTDDGETYAADGADRVTRLIALSSDLVKAYAKNSGYSVGDTTTEDRVKMATLGVFVELAYQRSEKGLDLPDGWATSPMKLAAEAILTGDMPLEASLDKGSAVGGWLFSTHDADVTNARDQRASRKNLEGW